MNPPGRRTGNPDTRAEILAAAREIFSQSGYDRATIRAIAGRAGVDPALIHHYFGTKAGLFAESISLPFSPLDVVAQVLTGDLTGVGERLARLFFSVWEIEEARASLLGILRTALAGDDRALVAFRQFIHDAVRHRIAPRLGGADTDDGTDAELRVQAIASQLVGMAVLRYVVKVEPLASTPIDDLVALVGPRIQSYVTGEH